MTLLTLMSALLLPLSFLLSLLMFASVSFATLDRIDVSSLSVVDDSIVTPSTATTLLLHGSIAASKVLVVTGMGASSRDCRVVINVTMGHLSQIHVHNATFHRGLHLFVRHATVTAAAALVLDNVTATCSTSTLHLCPNISGPPGAPAGSLSGASTDGSHAFLLEIPPLSDQTAKNSAAHLSVAVTRSRFSFLDDASSPGAALGDAPLAYSFGAFAVHNQQAQRQWNPTQAVGVGFPPSALVHTTRMPFVSLALNHSSFDCASAVSAVSLLTCVSIGTGLRAALNFGWEQSFAQTSRNAHEKPGQSVADAMRNANFLGVTWPVALLLGDVTLSDLAFRLNCAATPNCTAVAVAEALLGRLRVLRCDIAIDPCKQDCAGVAVVSSYGDNYTASSAALAATTPPVAPSTTTVNATTLLNATTVAPAAAAGFAYSTAFPPPSGSTAVMVAESKFAIEQRELGGAVDSAAVAIVLRVADFAGIYVFNNTVSLMWLRDSNPKFLFASFIARAARLWIRAGNAVADASVSAGVGVKAAVLQLRVIFAVEEILVEDFVVTNLTATGVKVALFGFDWLAHFRRLVLQRVAFTATTYADYDIAGIVFGYTEHGLSVEVLDLVANFRSGKNSVGFFFDNGDIRNVSRGFAFRRINATFRVGKIGNLLFQNSSFTPSVTGGTPSITPGTPSITLSDFQYTPSGRDAATCFVATVMMAGVPLYVIESGRMNADVDGGVYNGGILNAIHIGGRRDKRDNPHNLNLDTRVVVINVQAVVRAGLMGAAAVVSMAHSRPYGSGIDPRSDNLAQLEPVRAAAHTFIACSVTVLPGALVSSFLVMHNVALADVWLRGTRIDTTHFFSLLPAIGARAELAGVDASAHVNSSGGFVCSRFAGKDLIGRRAIYSAVSCADKPPSFIAPCAGKLRWVRARHCGETESASLSDSRTRFIPPKPSLTPTVPNITNTTTKTRSASPTVSLLPPPLDLSTPAGPNAVGATASIAGALGGAGASVALDAARAVAILTIVSRCTAYRETDKGLTVAERRQRFQDVYLRKQPDGFPHSFLPICFGDPRGACVRGAFVANILFMLIALLGAALFGLKTFRGFPRKVQLQYGFAAVLTLRFAKAQFFVGMAFAFVVGPWMTSTVVLLAVPGLPDGDTVIAIASIVIIATLVGAALVAYVSHLSFVATEAQLAAKLAERDAPRLSSDDDDSNDGGDKNRAGAAAKTHRSRGEKRRRKQQRLQERLSDDGRRRAVGSIWRCEESFLHFDIEDPAVADRRFELEQQRLQAQRVKERRSWTASQREAAEARRQDKSKKAKGNVKTKNNNSGGGRLTVASLMAMPRRAEDDDEELGEEMRRIGGSGGSPLLVSPLLSSDDDDGFDDDAVEREAAAAYERQNRFSNSAAAVSRSLSLSSPTRKRYNASSPSRSFEDGDDYDVDDDNGGDDPLFRGVAPHLRASLSPKQTRYADIHAAMRDERRRRLSAAERRKRAILSSPTTMQDLLLQTEQRAQQTQKQQQQKVPPLKRASCFHRFIWAATRWLSTPLGRFLLVGHVIWTDDRVMAAAARTMRLQRAEHLADVVLGHSDELDLASSAKDEQHKKAVVAGGAIGSLMWNFGTLLNKYVGPSTRDVPLSESKKRKSAKQQRAAEQGMLQEKCDVGGVPVRRSHDATLRLRLAPYGTFFSLLWTLAVCIAQGVALSDPEQCSAAVIVVVAVNCTAFVFDCYLRPFLVPARNVLVIIASAFLLGSSLIHAFATPSPTDSLADLANGLTLTFIIMLLVVGVLNLVLKFLLFFGKGAVISRREMFSMLTNVLEGQGDRDRLLDVNAAGQFIILSKADLLSAADDEEEDFVAVRNKNRANHASVIDSLASIL